MAFQRGNREDNENTYSPSAYKKTTQIYAEVTKTKINEDMTSLEKRIEGKYELAEMTAN